MKKRSGPSLRKEKRPLKRCPQCNGRGVVKPMFYELPCDYCGHSGLVCKETGDPLEKSDLILQLTIRLREQKEKEATLRKQLADVIADKNDRGYGAAGSRYHGD